MGAIIQSYNNLYVTPVTDADDALKLAVALKASTTFARGTALGEITATPGTYGPYASANVDGTQNPTCILPFDCVTDASGNITKGVGVTAGQGPFGITELTADCYFSGVFVLAELANLDAAGQAKCGRTLGNGRFALYGS